MSLPLQEGMSASGVEVQDGDMPVLTDPDGQFARNYNRRHFLFPHGLKNHPLFELPNLIELAKRPLHHVAYWSNGKVNANDPWGINRDTRLSLIDTIANIGDNNSLVLLNKVAQDPVYGPVFQDLLARVVALSGEQMRRDVVSGEVTILISSPNRLTSYHMDQDCNFLIQVAGNKTLMVYDHTDPTLVSHEEREQFHMGNINSIVYDERRQCEAATYELHAGRGVHIPVFAPHWARNHDNISVALSVNFLLRPVLIQQRIYRVNSVLRKLGVAPVAPGVSDRRDRLKLAAAKGLSAARGLVGRKRTHPVWGPRRDRRAYADSSHAFVARAME